MAARNTGKPRRAVRRRDQARVQVPCYLAEQTKKKFDKGWPKAGFANRSAALERAVEQMIESWE